MKTTMMILYVLAAMLFMPSCGSTPERRTVEPAAPTQPVSLIDSTKYILPDSATYYSEVVNKKNCFIVIAKHPEYRLYVCEVVGGDTVKRVHYPVCVGLNKGQKQKKGDMKTPECTVENPFTITEIVDASKWTHDFGDGRGSILSYGNWFMRLKTPGFSGIGIHGSTNNESSVPGRGSEGCIRLRNNDLDELKAKYAFVGMRVVIQGD